MKRYSAEEVYPKSQLGKCMVYFNMSHHYRRIYSAKPRVDTNLSKKSPSSFCCSSPDVFNFVRRNCMKQPLLSTPRHRICAKVEEEQKPFKPKILGSRAESKLRSLPVYQPPERITIAKPLQTENSALQVNFQDEKDEEKNVEDVIVKFDETDKTECKDDSSKSKKKKGEDIKKEMHESQKEERLRPVDKSTVMFLKDITDDILEKGIYTNKSLEKLFNHHMSKNKYNLSKDLMEQEISKLKKELEMPIEEEHFFSESSVEDEEVLTALDSLLLPADIREQVASSLGLKRRPPPLPSPKDSFTGSLALTSMSETVEKKEDKSIATYTLKTDGEEKNSDKQEKGETEVGIEQSLNQHPESSKIVQSDDDKTTADEEYSEEVNSEHKSNISEEIEEQNSINTEVKTPDKIDTVESGSEEKDVSEEKSDQESDQDDESDGESSDLSSIHTESN